MTTSERIDAKVKELRAVKDVVNNIENMISWYVTTDDDGKTIIDEIYTTEVTTYKTILQMILKKYDL